MFIHKRTFDRRSVISVFFFGGHFYRVPADLCMAAVKTKFVHQAAAIQCALYTVFQKKVVHQAHIDNLVNSQRIFKILSLTTGN